MANFLRDMVETLKDDNVSILEDGLGSAEYTGCVDTGCLALNALLSGTILNDGFGGKGGVPNNSVTAFAGDPATGKTFFVLGILKHFLDKNPENVGFLYETESAVRKSMATQRGIDTDRVLRAEPETLQEFRTMMLHHLNYYAEAKKNRPDALALLDSLGMLSTIKEVTDSTEGKDTRDMTRAQLIRGIFRVLRLKLAKLQVPLLVTNHVTAGIGQYAPPKVISGGSGLLYAADTIVLLSKSKDKDGTEVVGNIIKCKTYKSRMSRENQEVELKLSYESGLDKWYGMRQIAEKGGLLTKASTKLVLPDGSKVYGKEIDENPEQVFGGMMEELNEAVRLQFTYQPVPKQA